MPQPGSIGRRQGHGKTSGDDRADVGDEPQQECDDAPKDRARKADEIEANGDDDARPVPFTHADDIIFEGMPSLFQAEQQWSRRMKTRFEKSRGTLHVQARLSRADHH
jgi:hypothetical protein